MSAFVRQAVRRMQGYTPGAQPRGDRIVKLNTNENPYPPSPRVVEALRTLDPVRLKRYPDPLSMDLRQAIAELHGCAPDEVFAGNGSDEVLALCTRAFVEDDGAIGYFEPSYSLYPVLADIRGARRLPLDLDASFDWPRDAAGRLAVPEDPACTLFFFTNPNAPTGLQCSRAEVRAFCERFRGAVVLDEAYVDFAREHHMDLARALPNVLVARSLSKSYALAGLRVGYIVGHRDLIGALFKIKDSYNLDVLSQSLALAAVRDQAHMREGVARVRATRERLSARLRAMGWTVFPSQANFVWCRPAGVGARALAEALAGRQIYIRYFAGPRTGDCVRISVGTDAETDALLAAIEGLGPSV